MKIILPKEVKKILSVLNQSGFEAYIVGGCVRDILMKKAPHDFDFTTSATPEQIKSLFNKTADTGIKHGTVTVIENGIPFEVTTFRTESGYSDLRRPDRVCFVKDIKEDLSRRDFTMNAIACSLSGEITDPFGGQTDIKNKVIKTVGDPYKRFSEDALRILRLFRFSSALDFSLEKNTLSAALTLTNELNKISTERIVSELKKTLCSDFPENSMPLFETKALSFLGIESCPKLYNLKLIRKNTDLRMFAFLKESSKNAFETAKKLKLSRNETDKISDLLYIDKNLKSEEKADIKTVLSKLKYPEVFGDFIDYAEIYSDFKCEKLKANYNEILNNKEPYTISGLAIDGSFITAFGISGKEVGNELYRLLKIVIRNPELNRKELLLKLINKGN